MRRTLSLAVLAALAAACVTVEPAPDPRGAVKPGQRVIVMVYQCPGPWLVADPDNKAESAMKLLPLGTFLQGMQEDRINDLSKEIQPYLPRPRYDLAVEAAIIASLKASHGGIVQTGAEAGITPQQRKDWNAASDQLGWRRKYYFTDGGTPSPRNYSKLLSLDDAVILEVNLSFGLEPDEEDRALPALNAASRLYRADTVKMLWAAESRLSDTASSSTLSEFRAAPADLTDRIYALSEPMGRKISETITRAAGLLAPPPQQAPTPSPATFYNGAPTEPAVPGVTDGPPAVVEPAPAPSASTGTSVTP